jgi:hypothetical protein
VAHDDAQIDFLVSLLVKFGLLAPLPRSDPPRWLLPMRLPDRQAQLEAQGRFQTFLARMDSSALVPGLRDAVKTIAEAAAGPSVADLEKGCDVADAKVASLLADGPDPHGLSRDECAAINLFTQDVLYGALNAALRSGDSAQLQPYWGYIRLLNTALGRLPLASKAGTVFRGIKPPGSHCYELEQLQRCVPTDTQQCLAQLTHNNAPLN